MDESTSVTLEMVLELLAKLEMEVKELRDVIINREKIAFEEEAIKRRRESWRQYYETHKD